MAETSKTGILPLRWALALLAAGLAAAFFFAQFHLSHDNSWYLIATRRFLDGARLYVDIIELNPPLAFYLTVPGLLLADMTGWSDKSGYVAYVAALATAMNLWSASLIVRASLPRAEKLLLLVLAPVITLLLPISEFGQREHLLLILTLPYFLAIMLHDRRALGPLEQILLGLVAALGLALKPYFFAAPLLLWLLICARKRSLAPAFGLPNLAIAAATLAYLAFIWRAHPEYIEEIVPLATSVYQSYGVPLWRRMAQPFLLALPFLAFALRGSETGSRHIAADSAAIAAGFVLAYYVQFKGFNYHVLPAAAYLLFAATWLGFHQRKRLRESIFLSVLAMLAFLGTLGQQLIRGPYQPATLAEFEAFVPRSGMKIMVVTANVNASFPFVNHVEGQWSSRYPAQWLFPGSLNELRDTDCSAHPQKCDALNAILDRARRDLVDDLRSSEPDLIYVDVRRNKSHFWGTPFDYYDFMREEAGFADWWADYEKIGDALGFEVWQRICENDDCR